MNDLWAVGLTGAMVGGALGWPLLRYAGGSGEAAADQPRMLGAMFLIGAAAVTLIATSHGGIAPPLVSGLLDHIEYASDLVFWALLTLWLRRATGLDTSAPAIALMVFAPLLLYGAAAAATDAPPRFIWLLPASVLGVGYAIVRGVAAGAWRRRTAHERLVARMIVFAAALCVAQAIRTVWPHVAMWREIVPLTMTAGFLSIATLGIRSAFGADSGSADVSPEPYARSALDSAAAARVLDALARGMEHEKWYRDPLLTLPRLAEKLGTTPHAISQALNQVDG